MTAGLPATNGPQVPARTGPAPMTEVMERLVTMGDLSKLSPQDRVAYYVARCEAAGLDPRTQPFQYLSLQGKLTLYATKTATDQLIAIHKLTVEIVDRKHERDIGIFEVQCRVRFPDGHHVEDFAALNVKGLQGEGLCNALMKCVTKAKRRTVLSACGLGMLDETEVETIPGAARVVDAPPGPPAPQAPPQNDSGFGRGQYATEEQTEAFVGDMEDYLKGRNQEWFDRWTDRKTGEVPPSLKDICNIWQLDNHLVKWGVETGRLHPSSLPEGGIKNRQIGRYTAIIENRSKAEKVALRKEVVRYVDEQESRQTELLRKKHPELFGDADADEAQGMADEDPPIGDASTIIDVPAEPARVRKDYTLE